MPCSELCFHNFARLQCKDSLGGVLPLCMREVRGPSQEELVERASNSCGMQLDIVLGITSSTYIRVAFMT